MYIRINGDRNNFLIRLARKINVPFFKVCYFDGYKSVWFNFFK